MRARAFTSPRALFLTLILASLTLSCKLATDLAGRIRSEAPGSAGNDLIVYVGLDGNIYTIDRQGENVQTITQDANPSPAEGEDSLVYRYPTWAPDGRQLAFVEFSDLGGVGQRARVLNADTSRGSAAEAIFSSDQNAPFYLFWSPDSRQLSFLGSAEGAGALALHLAAADGSGSQLVATGQPFYWDWSPVENEIFIHTGGSVAVNPDAKLAYLALDGTPSSQDVDLRPGSFQAPAWSPDGRFIALAAEMDDGSDLVLLERESGEQQTIATSRGLTAFSWSPDGSSLAYSIPASDRLERDLFLHHPSRPGEERLLSTGFISAFFWSPDSRKLAIFEPTLTRSGEDVSYKLQEPAAIYLKLSVMDVESGASRHLLTFDPSEAFLGLLPFYDQYQRSNRLWSPDSQALVVTTLDEQGTPGVYAIDTGSGTLSRIASGDMAFWSWK